MRILWPDGLDRFVPVDRTRHNALQTDNTTVQQTDLLILLQEIESRVGEIGSLDTASFDFRVSTLEASVLSLQSPRFAAGPVNAVQFNRRGYPGGVTEFVFDEDTSRLQITGRIGIGRAPGTYALEIAGHAFVQGPDGFNATNETAALYLGDSTKYIRAVYGTGLQLVVNQGVAITIDENYRRLGLIDQAIADTAIHIKERLNIADNTSDEYMAGITLQPEYYDTEAGGWTVSRHNYLDLRNVTLLNGALCTDACVFRFDAAAGTHKALDSGTTKTSPGTVSAWWKVNANGTVLYAPLYASKTS